MVTFSYSFPSLIYTDIGFFGTTIFYGITKFRTNIPIYLGNNGETALNYSSYNTNKAIVWASDTIGKTWIYTDYANKGKDHDLPTFSHPTIVGFSATDPDTDNQQYWLIQHDSSDLIITTKTGNVKLGDVSHIPIVPTLTTAERDALTGVNGMIIYNSTTTQIEAYFNGSWGAI